MYKLKLLLLIALVIVAGYGMHLLIRKYINPRDSINHLFLFFLAHFIGIFSLSFIINFLIIRFSEYIFH